jgi:hypothetical protein
MDSSKARHRSAPPPFERLAHLTMADQELCSISGTQGSFEPHYLHDTALMSRLAIPLAAGF